MDELQEAIKEFVIEGHENLDQLDSDLVNLSLATPEMLGRIFRTLHTIKGSCAFLGFAKLEAIAHAGENLLARLRDGRVAIDADVVSVLLEMVDVIRAMLTLIEADGKDGDEDYSALLQALESYVTSSKSDVVMPPLPPTTPTTPATRRVLPPSNPTMVGFTQSNERVPVPIMVPQTEATDNRAPKTVAENPAPKGENTRGANPRPKPIPPEKSTARIVGSPSPENHENPTVTVTASASTSPRAVSTPVSPNPPVPPRPRADALLPVGQPDQKLKSTSARSSAEKGSFSSSSGILGGGSALDRSSFSQSGVSVSQIADHSVRIDVGKLDKLMALASELVLARNQILQGNERVSDPLLNSACRNLNIIATELQEEIAKTRMQPIGSFWGRLQRQVRDLEISTGKRVRILLEGGETEIDKTILDAIRDPLLHLIRNAMDHGIEPPEERARCGKPSEGVLLVRAYHEGGQVNIEVSDDGAGINPQAVKRKALERGLLSADDILQMSDQTLLGLIFLPGFSTSNAVNKISGRGVGMDVVKTHVENVGGTVDAQSTVGQGTTMKLRIPLTLAIIKGIVVSAAGDRFVIPQAGIVELVRLEGEKARRATERIHDIDVFRYRDRLLPVVHLARELEIHDSTNTNTDVLNLVILQTEDRWFGLIVDRIIDAREIVVKPFWKQLKSIACFGGATIMGDGKVALILDIFGLAQQAQVAPKLRDLSVVSARGSEVKKAVNKTSLLLTRSSDQARLAILLEQVIRLEVFPTHRLEQVANQTVIQYDGDLLPLVDVGAFLNQRPTALWSEPLSLTPSRERVQVVVCRAASGKTVGLAVDSIRDISAHALTVRGRPWRACVSFTTVIDEQVTELLDVVSLLANWEAMRATPQVNQTPDSALTVVT